VSQFMCMDRTSLGVTWETFIVIMCSSRSSINKLFNSSSSHGLDFTASNERNCVCVCLSGVVQEQMLKSGHVWHFKTYDKRPEFAQVRNSIAPKFIYVGCSKSL